MSERSLVQEQVLAALRAGKPLSALSNDPDGTYQFGANIEGLHNLTVVTIRALVARDLIRVACCKLVAEGLWRIEYQLVVPGQRLPDQRANVKVVL